MAFSKVVGIDIEGERRRDWDYRKEGLSGKVLHLSDRRVGRFYPYDVALIIPKGGGKLLMGKGVNA